MISRPIFTSVLLIAVGLTASLFSADPPAAVEKDKRLHADGKSWKLNKAVIEDATRPRVLLIGDSILGGYMNDVIKAMDGKAYVDAWMHPHAQSEHLNKLLGEMLDNGPYDIVHFNMGLHGWQKGRIPDGAFKPLTLGFIEVIRKKSPKARIIWASITPVTVKGKPTELDPEINPVIIEQNRMAAEVMKEAGVPINDFYAIVIGKLDLARGDQFHWKAEAYKLMAESVVASLGREMKEVAAMTK